MLREHADVVAVKRRYWFLILGGVAVLLGGAVLLVNLLVYAVVIRRARPTPSRGGS